MEKHVTNIIMLIIKDPSRDEILYEGIRYRVLFDKGLLYNSNCQRHRNNQTFCNRKGKCIYKEVDVGVLQLLNNFNYTISISKDEICFSTYGLRKFWEWFSIIVLKYPKLTLSRSSSE